MAIYPDKKDGKLTGRFRVELQRGKERYRKRWPTLKEAEADEAAVTAAWARGEGVAAPGQAPGAPKVHTFASVIPLAKGQLWRGQSDERGAWRRMEEAASIIGLSSRLDSVDTGAVDRLAAALRRRALADATVNRYLSHLLTFLKWSRDRKYRTAPLEDVKFSWGRESAGRIRWITAEEEAALLGFLDGPSADLARVAIATGCRRGELMDAKLDQISGNRLHLWKTKSRKARTVPMTDATRDLLARLIQDGTMPTTTVLQDRWAKARSAMGLADDPHFVFHTTRHTCATRLLDAGVNIFVIQEWLGHSRIDTTLRYAHVKPQNLDDALARVGDMAARGFGNCQFPAAYGLLHASPTVGGMGPQSAAAV